MAKHDAAVSAIFSALADPTRRRILTRLSGRPEFPVTDLAKPFAMALPSFSRHLQVLEGARLISRRRRGRQHLIRGNPAGLREAQRWIAQCAEVWESRFDALEAMLQKELGASRRRVS